MRGEKLSVFVPDTRIITHGALPERDRTTLCIATMGNKHSCYRQYAEPGLILARC